MKNNRSNGGLPSAILLGGGINTLSVSRSLGRQGVEVLSLSLPPSHVQYSRYAQWIPMDASVDVQTQWLEWLTTKKGRYRGSVVLACGDDALEFLAIHRKDLEEDYLLDLTNDRILMAMLDKAQTYAIAKAANVPAPDVWVVNTMAEVEEILERIKYPCGLKPRVSHVFKQHFDLKLFVVHGPEELLRVFTEVSKFDVEMLVTEIIPGGEERYCSYYTYIDENGKPLFHFTKRKLRQYPNGFGYGTYHATDWNPEVAEMGLRFCKGSGLRGLANVEFKRDPRDGLLKLMECNHRFTESNELVKASGLDLGLLVYNRLTQRPLPPLSGYKKGLYLVRPVQDFLAFRSLNKKRELTWSGWIRSLMHRQRFVYFSWSDPLPFVYSSLIFIRRQMRKIRGGANTKKTNSGAVKPKLQKRAASEPIYQTITKERSV